MTDRALQLAEAVTDAMVNAYLDAQSDYCVRADRDIRIPFTPQHACRAGLAAALAALSKGAPSDSAVAPQAVSVAPVSDYVLSAPERIWLNVFTDEPESDLTFPDDHEGITWCTDVVGDADIAYIRADLATAPAPSRDSLIPNPTTEGPRVPDYVLTCVHAYGDARADDDGTSPDRLGEAIREVRRWAASLTSGAEGQQAEPSERVKQVRQWAKEDEARFDAKQAARTYPLPDDLYPGSKDWMAGDYAARVEWLHTMYESKRREVGALIEQAARSEAPAGWKLVPINPRSLR